MPTSHFVDLKVGGQVKIGKVLIKVVRGGRVKCRLGVTAPRDVVILREEARKSPIEKK